MQSVFLKAKLHRASVTHVEPDYDGSCAIDANLLELTQLQEFEQIQIYSLTNGERFTTYIIKAEAGSGIISMNGAAAHKANPGDQVIICAYGHFSETEILQHKPRLVFLREDNSVERIANSTPAQAA
ncbi:MAG: aspartate 1-decarboxylase [Pseudomonadota bacterium]|nr:aspartate 1-decarboxylase [Pseudomonadota bacterium]